MRHLRILLLGAVLTLAGGAASWPPVAVDVAAQNRSPSRPAAQDEFVPIDELPPQEQVEWLERCVRGRWSVHRLEDEHAAARRAARDGQPADPAPTGRPPRPPARLSHLAFPTSAGGWDAVQLRLFAPPEKVERWKAEADSRGIPFPQLVEEALDAFVATPVGVAA